MKNKREFWKIAGVGGSVKGSNLYTKELEDCQVYVNYATPIAFYDKVNNQLYVIKQKFSQTTSKNQSYAKYYGSAEEMESEEFKNYLVAHGVYTGRIY